MPWTSDDAGDHTHHADTASKKKAWADTANAALKAGKSEADAIKEANAVVLKMSADGRAAAIRQMLKGTAIETRFATFKPSTYDAKARTVEVVMSTGAAVERYYGTEVLLIEAGAINLERLASCGVPVIDSHNVFGIGGVFGNLQRAWLDAGQLLGLLLFDDSEAGRKAEGLVARGMIRAVSIGYRVDEWKITDPDGNVIDPEKERMQWDVKYTFTAIRWTLFEVSLVSVPADQDAVFRSHAGAGGIEHFNPELLAQSRAVTLRSGNLSITYEFGARGAPIAAGDASSNDAALARMRARQAIAARS
jgi:uncharacterized protein YdaT